MLLAPREGKCSTCYNQQSAVTHCDYPSPRSFCRNHGRGVEFPLLLLILENNLSQLNRCQTDTPQEVQR